MEIHLQMHLLNIIAITLGVFLTSFTQTKPPIDIEKVKSDMIAAEGHNAPPEFIRERRKEMFLVMYAGDMCFVHLNYRDYHSEPQMKPSIIAVYRLQENQWKLKKIDTYYYNVELLDASSRVFFSNNEFCEPNGVCASYTEFSVFKDDEFKAIADYTGFNKELYYGTLSGSSENKKLAKVPGDTIVNEFLISNARVEAGRRLSFKLEQRVGVLKSVSDTLSIVRTSKSTFVKIGLP